MKRIIYGLMICLAVIVVVSVVDESFDKIRERAYADSLSACRDSLEDEKIRFELGRFMWDEDRKLLLDALKEGE